MIRFLRSSTGLRLAPAVVALLWLLLSANLAVFVALYQPNVLSWDQWDFYNPLFEGGNGWDLFHYQHGPHRQGLGFVLTAVVMKLTHWDSRWDSLWIAGVLSLSALFALRLRWKLAGRITWADAWIPLLGLALTQYETVVVTPNVSHSIFPLLLVLLGANTWLATRKSLSYPASGLIAVALTFTGFGLFGGILLTVLLGVAVVRAALRREAMRALWAATGLLIAIAGWVVFAHDYQFNPAVAGFRFPWTPLSDYARFVVLMLFEPAGFGGASSAHYLAGCWLALAGVAALVIAVVFWIRRRDESAERWEVVLLLLGAGWLFVANTAVGRVCLGVTAGMSSRYVSLIFPLWLGIYLAAAESRRRPVFWAMTATVWALALAPYSDLLSRKLHRWPGTLGATHENLQLVEAFTTNRAGWAEVCLRTGGWEKAQEAYGTAVYPAPAATHMDEKLSHMRAHGLSFFHGPDRMQSLLPWLQPDRTIWNEDFPGRNTHHPLEQTGRLTFVTKQRGYLEILLAPTVELPASQEVRVEAGGTTTAVQLRHERWVTLPLEPGLTTVRFTRVDLAAPPLTVGPARVVASPTPGAVRAGDPSSKN